MRNVTAGASRGPQSGDAAIAAVVEHLKGSAMEVDSGDTIPGRDHRGQQRPGDWGAHR